MNLSKKDLKELEIKTAKYIFDSGQYIFSAWNKVKKISYKDQRDAVSEIDINAEIQLRNQLHKLLPEAGFIVEEGKSEKKPEYNWVIDPIDGTNNYISGLPIFYTQIALADAHNFPILGHVYNPVSNQFFSASLGNGATLNNKKIELIKRTNLNSCIVEIEFGGIQVNLNWRLKLINKLAPHFFRIRLMGGLIGIYMLTGAIDVYINISDVYKPVDVLPRHVILREAGLLVEYLNKGTKQEIILACNNLIFPKIVNLLK